MVNAILEGNLPPHLADMDQSLQRQPKPVPEHLQDAPDMQGRSKFLSLFSISKNQNNTFLT